MILPARSVTPGRPITVYIKPSDYCNVGCDHCYIPARMRADRSIMTEDILRDVIATVRDMVERQRATGAHVIWHGGEPLALPTATLDRYCRIVHDEMPDATQSIQTSLIPYGPRWVDIISRHFSGHIGSSIDFSSRAIRGNPARYLEFWMKKVDEARADGFEVVPGTVPSRRDLSRAREMCEWFARHGFRAWNIDRYNSYAREDPARPSNAEHSAFLTSVFDAVMDLARREDIFLRVNTIVAALRGLLYGLPGDRWGTTCSRDFLVVNPDGSTNACPDKISYETHSNVTEGADAFQKSAPRKAWIREHLFGHRNTHCGSCRFRNFCQGGCPLTPNTPSSEGDCSGYSSHLRHVARWLDGNRDLAVDYLARVRA